MNELQLQVLSETPIQDIEQALKKCRALEITSEQSLIDCDGIIGRLRFYLKQIGIRKKSLCQPYKNQIKEITDFAKKFETEIDNASRALLEKKSAYMKKIEAEKQKKLMSAKLDTESILSQANDIIKTAEPPAVKKVTVRKYIEIVNYDLKKVPAQYLILNEAMVKKDIKAGKKIQGLTYKIVEKEGF
jgi:hypothetical protein